MTHSSNTINEKKKTDGSVFSFLTTKFAPSMSLSGHVPGHPDVA